MAHTFPHGSGPRGLETTQGSKACCVDARGVGDAWVAYTLPPLRPDLFAPEFGQTDGRPAFARDKGTRIAKLKILQYCFENSQHYPSALSGAQTSSFELQNFKLHKFEL